MTFQQAVMGDTTLIATTLRTATADGRRSSVVFTLRPDQAMGGSEQLDVLGVALHRDGEAGRREDLVERVADVLQFVVKLVAVVLEPILEAFEQVGGEVRAITRGIAMQRDLCEPIGEQGMIAHR